ncbi:hypothetical protein [Bacillus licheniformis]|uniref:hypothetical protein n=1 Tax=Bacillus licheniformis TaxID=1402 RepID=UPI0009C2B579|nr:hypothetical protein [Bacillus licheniformis]ARC72425.1 hypothetical protein B37_00370 [Bacillus licheniformis]ARW41560.1 hypothetical protein S100141_00235 [Bacillus licheniformis]ARW53035.1 hypothetical protein S100027_01036 [Bacillus licheniformis]
MAETKMNVQLIAHTLVSEKFAKMFALNETKDALTDVGELFREGEFFFIREEQLRKD